MLSVAQTLSMAQTLSVVRTKFTSYLCGFRGRNYKECLRLGCDAV